MGWGKKYMIIKNFLKNRMRDLFNFEIIKTENYKEAILQTYNKKLSSLFKRLIKIHNPIIFDVGAHRGDTIERYRLMFSEPIIYSFEPNKDLYDILIKKYSNKRNLNIYEIGLSDINGIRRLNIATNDYMSSIEEINYKSKFFQKRGIKHHKTSKINLKTLDSFCNENNIEKIDILKLNIQGHEPNCLIGSKNLLKMGKIKFIIIELEMGDRYGVNNQFYSIEKHIVPFNYSLYDIILIKKNKLNRIQMINAIYCCDQYEFQSD